MSTATQEEQNKVVTVQIDDPFQSLFTPSFNPRPETPHKPAAFASAPIYANTKAQTFLPPNVEPTFNDPLLRSPSTLQTEYVPKEQYIKAKRSARDGWLAVMVLGTFIAAGMYWFVDRVGSDAVKIDTLMANVDDLNKQIASERGVVVARNQEVQMLDEQLAEERARNGARKH